MNSAAKCSHINARNITGTKLLRTMHRVEYTACAKQRNHLYCLSSYGLLVSPLPSAIGSDAKLDREAKMNFNNSSNSTSSSLSFGAFACGKLNAANNNTNHNVCANEIVSHTVAVCVCLCVFVAHVETVSSSTSHACNRRQLPATSNANTTEVVASLPHSLSCFKLSDQTNTLACAHAGARVPGLPYNFAGAKSITLSQTAIKWS